jgi:hypothetical protein
MGAAHATVQIRRIGSEISVNSRRRLQHLQTSSVTASPAALYVNSAAMRPTHGALWLASPDLKAW